MDLPFKEYFDSLPCYLTVQDRDLRIVRANRLFREDFGDWEGRHCYQVYKHQSEPCDVCPVLRSFRDGKRHSSEEHVAASDGRDLSLIVYTTPIRNDGGEVETVMEMSADITSIKHFQRRLRESRQRYRTLFEEVPCYISIQDQDLRIIEANRPFRETFGDELGRKCYEIYKHRTEQCIPCAVQETFSDGQMHHSEEVVSSRSGKQINTLVYTAPIRDEAGVIRSVMEMSADITPIRDLQTQLESIGLLISSVSHGVKGLLNGLDGGMYLLNTGVKKGDAGRQKKGLEMVQRNVDRIRAMVMNILYYAKERIPNWETVSAPELAQEVLSVVESKAAELGVVLTGEVDPDAGPFDADPQAMRSMLVNLLENSLDACRVDTKQPEHEVHFRVQGFPDRVLFEIEDDGIGMDQETREKAFSLFFSSKGVKGTGLGLFIASKIVRSHQGDINLESELDKGTRLGVTIPRRHMRGAEESEGDPSSQVVGERT